MYELLFKNLKPNDSIVFEAPNRTSLTYKELDNMLIALKKNFQELSITTTDPDFLSLGGNGFDEI